LIPKRRKGSRDSGSYIFALVSLYIELSARYNIQFTNKSAISIKESTGSFNEVLSDIRAILDTDNDVSYSMKKDRYGYIWIVLDGEMESSVAVIHTLADMLEEQGFSQQILASVFLFSYRGKSIYLVYNHKSKKFYPFAPLGGRSRDHELEMLVYSITKNRVDVENDTGRWYPIWDIPTL
jgi:hypothetical protein